MIILLHVRPFHAFSDQLDLAFNNILTRICVPFFFLINGYFVAQKEREDPLYIRHYIKKQLPFYLTWSMLHLPVIIVAFWQGSSTISQLSLPFPLSAQTLLLLSPVFLLIALFYTGTYYHLWYFPALFFSLQLLSLWKRRFSIRTLLLLSAFFLLFGATETYHGILPASLNALLAPYFTIFYTTRNFLFFASFYVVLGYKLGTWTDLHSSLCFTKLFISVFLLIFEGLFLHDTQRLDSNILLFSVPVVYYLFLTLIHVKPLFAKEKNSLRALSKYYYLLHPFILFLFSFLIQSPIETVVSSTLLFSAIVYATHLSSQLVLFLKKRYPHLSFMIIYHLSAVLSGQKNDDHFIRESPDFQKKKASFKAFFF